MTENFMVMLMVGVIIPGASLCGVCLVIWAKDRVQKWRRDAFGTEVIFISVTQIATDLVPLMWKLVRNYGDELQMRTFGVDGAYFNSVTAWLWDLAIKKSLSKGVKVDYVLCEVDPKAKESLSKLVEWSSSRGHALHVYVLRASRPSNVEKHLDEMRTRHPTLFSGPDDVRAMWLEGKHKEGGTYAYNVRYVSPKAMAGKWRQEFSRQQDMLDDVVAASEEPFLQKAA